MSTEEIEDLIPKKDPRQKLYMEDLGINDYLILDSVTTILKVPKGYIYIFYVPDRDKDGVLVGQKIGNVVHVYESTLTTEIFVD
jgi:hypothetical protein